jgi:hypothetical protein
LEWEPNERDAWVADAQRWVTQIVGVQECQIKLDDNGEVEEVLVTAGTDKPSRLIVRDVETLLKLRAQVNIDYKKISVAQMIDPKPLAAESQDEWSGGPSASPGVTFHDANPLFEDPSGLDEDLLDDPLLKAPDGMPAEEWSDHPPESALGAGGLDPLPAVILAEEMSPRIICANVGVMSSDMVVRAEVLLQAGDLEALGVAEGPNHAESDTQLVARATVLALTELLAEPLLLHVQEVRLEKLGDQSVVLTAIDLVEGRRSETLFGTCSSRHNRQQAVVYAVLDALNRRLSLFGLKSGHAEG